MELQSETPPPAPRMQVFAALLFGVLLGCAVTWAVLDRVGWGNNYGAFVRSCNQAAAQCEAAAKMAKECR